MRKLGRDAQHRDRHAYEHDGFQEPEQQLLARAVIGEAVALEPGLAQHEAAHPDLAPESVPAQGGDGQQDVHDIDAEKRPARAMERELPAVARGRDCGRGRCCRRRRGPVRDRPPRRGCYGHGPGERGGRRGVRPSHDWMGRRRRRRAAHLLEGRGVHRGDDAALRALVALDGGRAAARARGGHHFTCCGAGVAARAQRSSGTARTSSAAVCSTALPRALTIALRMAVLYQRPASDPEKRTYVVSSSSSSSRYVYSVAALCGSRRTSLACARTCATRSSIWPGRSRCSAGPAADTAVVMPRETAAARSAEISLAAVAQSSRWSSSTRCSGGGFALMAAA